MFCKWCGKKIVNNGKPCPSCGKAQDSLENGNGFWDLCSNAPVTPIEMPVSSGSNDSVKTDKGNSSSPKNHSTQKTPAKLTLLLSGVSVLLLLILIIEVGVGISKTNKYEELYSSLYGGHTKINTAVNNRFDELMDYLTTGDKENESNQEVNPGETDSKVDVNVLLKSDDIMLVADNTVKVEVHEIESDNAKYLYIVSGDTLADDSTITVWQKATESADGNDCWETVAIGTTYIITSESNEANYRFLRVSYSEYLDEYILYVTNINSLSAVDAAEDESETPAKTGEDNETTPDATVPRGTEASSDETLPCGTEVANEELPNYPGVV